MARPIRGSVDELHQSVKELLEEGLSEADIMKQLKKKGVDDHYAETIIENVISDISDKRDFWKLVLMGSFTIAGDLIVGYLSFKQGRHLPDVFYTVFWGLMVAGAFMITRAFILFRK